MPHLVLDDGTEMPITQETATFFSLPCECGRRVAFRIVVEPLAAAAPLLRVPRRCDGCNGLGEIWGYGPTFLATQGPNLPPAVRAVFTAADARPVWGFCRTCYPSAARTNKEES